MTVEQNDPIDRLYQEQKVPTNHPYHRIDRDTLAWLEESDTDLARLAKVERLRRQNGERWATIIATCDAEDGKGILAGVYCAGGRATYSDLERWTTCSPRWVRERVYELAEADVLAVEEGRPTIVTYADETARVLVSDALSIVLDW